MTHAETVASRRLARLPRSIETDKKSWIAFTVNVASASGGDQCPTMRLDAPNVMSLCNTWARTIPRSGFAGIMADLYDPPGGTCPIYSLAETAPMHAMDASNVASLRNTWARTIPRSGFAGIMSYPYDPPVGTSPNYHLAETTSVYDMWANCFPTDLIEMASDPQAGIFPKRWLEQMTQNQTKANSEHAKREDEIVDMVSSSQSMLAVASSVFEATMRPLTNKERRYLGKFYNRAFKTR